ncbi:hypothetical protein M3Y94_01264000 [Aphelenchoides besseyi]|nr:hypothetical protein M3Y94_01264000 [Aphelenchoides besseyi]KAI6222572.1 hypothetical protein M3Y95_00907700 [Aphelenchoides besseyi]
MNSWLLLAVLLPFVLADDCTKPTGKTCDANVLSCCDNNLKSALGIDCRGKQTYDQPECLRRAIGGTYFNGSTGAYQFCDGYNEFRNCLGPTTQSCTTTEYFIESGRVPELAAFDEGMYARLNFMCGAGLETWLRNYDDDFNVKQSDLDRCASTFENSVHRNKKKACEYLKDFASCYQLSFADIPEMSWFICELARVSGAYLAPHCDLTCTASF